MPLMNSFQKMSDEQVRSMLDEETVHLIGDVQIRSKKHDAFSVLESGMKTIEQSSTKHLMFSEPLTVV